MFDQLEAMGADWIKRQEVLSHQRQGLTIREREQPKALQDANLRCLRPDRTALPD